ncbi:MAG: polysaccharide deacetylase family protein [Lachnospiraceae bacterium]|nr:polysaccharide deacetylase family protein [Lachnospiraceae bacterium]
MKKLVTGILLAIAVALLAGIIFLTTVILKQDRIAGEGRNTAVTASVQENTETASQAADSSAADLNAASTAELTAAELAAVTTDSSASAAAESVAENVQAADTAAAESAAAVTETVEADSVNSNTLYATTTVNVRGAANTEGEKLGQLISGQEVTKTGEEGEWTQIDYNGQTAFVKTEFLSTEKTTLRTDWDLASLSTEAVNFGYSSANRDERNIPTDWAYYDNHWGEFAVKWIGDTSKNTIYLTMDEGFGNDNTITILNTLREKNVKITFFVTKNFVDDRPELVQEMLNDGHQLGNHTCTHPNMAALSLDEQNDQIMTLQNLVKEKFNYDMKYFRFPQGIFSAETLGLVNNLGMETVFWSYAYNDYDEDNQPDVAESLDKALNALHPGAIYLLHASSDTNTAFIGDFIDGARERGYEFGELVFLG